MQNVHLNTTVISSKLESNLTHSNRYLELEICVMGKYALSSEQTYNILQFMSVYSTPDFVYVYIIITEVLI